MEREAGTTLVPRTGLGFAGRGEGIAAQAAATVLLPFALPATPA